MRTRCLLLPTLAFVLFSLVSAAAAPPQWLEVKSPNFTVLTDAGEKRGRDVTRRFEEMRAVFAELINKNSVNIPVPLQIVAFRRTKEYENYTHKFEGKKVTTAGYFLQGEDRNYILIDLSLPQNWETIFHEYAHMLVHGNLPRVPLWFDEGIAEYYSTIAVEGKNVKIGLPTSDAGYVLNGQKLLPLAELFSVKHDDRIYNTGEKRHLLYAQSWLAIHFFLDTKRANPLFAYVDLVNKGVEIPAAVQRAFGTDIPQLEKELQKYLRDDRVKYVTRPMPQGLDKLETNVTPVKEIDARVILADVHLRSRDHQELAMAEFTQILKEVPGHAGAHRGIGYAYLRQGDFKKAGEHFRRAAELNSNDPWVFYYSALMLNRSGRYDDGESEQAVTYLKRAIELNPSHADAHHLLGLALSHSGDVDGAIAALERSVALNPNQDAYRMNLAGLYMRRDRYDQARALYVQLAASGNEGMSEVAQQMVDQIDTRNSIISESRAFEMNGRNADSQQATELGRRNLDSPDTTEADEPFEPEPGALPVEAKVEFLRGTLTGVDCTQGSGAVLTITAGKAKWTMRTRDREKLIVIGADALSCGWKAKKVSVNYRKTGAGEGELVSLELY